MRDDAGRWGNVTRRLCEHGERMEGETRNGAVRGPVGWGETQSEIETTASSRLTGETAPHRRAIRCDGTDTAGARAPTAAAQEP